MMTKVMSRNSDFFLNAKASKQFIIFKKVHILAIDNTIVMWITILKPYGREKEIQYFESRETSIYWS